MKQRSGVRKDKTVLPSACLDAAFSKDQKTAVLATGLSKLSASRTMLIVDGTFVPICCLNARIVCRWGPHSSHNMHVPLIASEMPSKCTAGLMETLSRACPSLLSMDRLTLAVENSDLFVIVEIADAAASNLRHAKVQAMKLPKALVWLQACSSHAANLVTMRPFEAHDLVNGLFCYSRLTRLKARSLRLLFENIVLDAVLVG